MYQRGGSSGGGIVREIEKSKQVNTLDRSIDDYIPALLQRSYKQ